MPAPSDLDRLQEFLTVGPFGGLDPTTNPYYVAPPNFVDGENFVPNHGYGGFVTVMGRTVALAVPLPGPCFGMHKMTRQGQEDVYLFACDIEGASVTDPHIGALLWAPYGGVPTVFTLPQGGSLTSSQQTYFADCQSWTFITNGVDRPLKIDTDLNVTYWGILAPTLAPLPKIIGPGVLLGTYHYCFTWGNDVQESSQGVISAPITAVQATAFSNALHLIGTPRPGDIITIHVGQLGLAEYSVDYIVPSPLPPNLDLRTLAQAAAANFNVSPFVTQYATASPPTQNNVPAGTITLAAAQMGTWGNTVYFYARVTTAAGTVSNALQILPHTTTLLSGGADGNTIEVDVPSGLAPNDPQVTELNVYRIGGSLGTWNLLATIDPSAPRFIDNIPDSEVTGQQLIVFRDAPPAFSYIATHMERIFAFGINNDYNPTPTYDITADPSVMWWSNLNEPWGFNSEANNFTCGDNKFSDVAAGLMELGGVLLANKTRRAYFIYGSTDDDFQPQFAWFVGCDAPRSIATGYGFGFWHSRQGFHMTDGGSKTQISDAGFQQSNVKNILDSLGTADFATMCSFMHDRQYHASFPSRGFTLLFDMRDSQWYKLSFSCTQATYDLETDVQVVATNDKVTGQVDQWFASPCDFDGVVTARLTSRTTDGGVKHGTKRLERALLLAPIQPGVCAKVCITGDPGCTTQVSMPQEIDLGEGFPRHEWGVAPTAGGNIECDTFNLTLCVDGPAIIDTIAVYGWVPRVHAMGGPRTDFTGGGG